MVGHEGLDKIGLHVCPICRFYFYLFKFSREMSVDEKLKRKEVLFFYYLDLIVIFTSSLQCFVRCSCNKAYEHHRFVQPSISKPLSFSKVPLSFHFLRCHIDHVCQLQAASLKKHAFRYITDIIFATPSSLSSLSTVIITEQMSLSGTPCSLSPYCVSTQTSNGSRSYDPSLKMLQNRH